MAAPREGDKPLWYVGIGLLPDVGKRITWPDDVAMIVGATFLDSSVLVANTRVLHLQVSRWLVVDVFTTENVL